MLHISANAIQLLAWKDDLMELGVFTFADVDPSDGIDRGKEAERRMRDLMEEIRLADDVGLDVFGVGEHHRRRGCSLPVK